jgi:dihydroorotate dehydrogenase (NAD+) catalytic subunit
MVMNRFAGTPLLGAGTGGISGPALRPQSLAAVAAARAAVAIALVGLGGIETAADARDFLSVGATAVAVGTAIFVDPRAPRRVRDGLAT